MAAREVKLSPAADQDAIRRNLKHLFQHQNNANPKPIPHTTITRGFEAVAFPKIVRELRDDDLIVKQKSLLAARELLGSPMGYMQCISAGITPAVVALLKDADDVVRERAAGTLEYVAVKEVGARDIIQHGGVPDLVAQLQDPNTRVRDAAYRALIEAARFNAVREALTGLASALPLLMRLVLEEPPERSLQALVLLNAAVQARDNARALRQLVDDADAIPSLSRLIDAGQLDEIQEQSAQLLGLLCSTFMDAKLAAVTHGCVARLLVLLQKPGVTLAAAAATALMMITVLKEGKHAVLATDFGVAAMMRWLDPTNEHLCINIMELVSNVAEAPESRQQLTEHAVPLLCAIFDREDVSPHIKRSAAQALRRCGFRHRPFDVLPGRPAPDINDFTPAPPEEWTLPDEPIGKDAAPLPPV